jgi:predicted nucleotidyltransferase
MLATLKLIAWVDRHALQPRKDATDLLLMLRNYLSEANTNRLYEEAAQLLEADDFDYEVAGAWLIGHDAAATIGKTSSEASRLFDALYAVLDPETDADGQLRLISECGLDPEFALRLLRSFSNGLRAEI